MAFEPRNRAQRTPVDVDARLAYLDQSDSDQSPRSTRMIGNESTFIYDRPRRATLLWKLAGVVVCVLFFAVVLNRAFAAPPSDSFDDDKYYYTDGTGKRVALLGSTGNDGRLTGDVSAPANAVLDSAATFDVGAAKTLSGNFVAAAPGGGQSVITNGLRPAGRMGVNGNRFVDGTGASLFLFGVNYEGHTDRAWQMWDTGKFDKGLIESDFAAAQRAGITSVRIFVSGSLRDAVNRGDFSMLDTVFDLARAHGLYLLLTFNDYGDRDLSRVAAVEVKIAAHLRPRTNLLGYDLRNEPHFADIVGAVFPAGVTPPLLTDEMIKKYGERISQADTDKWRKSGGNAVVPSYLDAVKGYYFANAYKLYNEFSAAALDWANTHAGFTSLDYIGSPDAASWIPFWNALDSTLAAWIDAQQKPVLAVDPNRLTTVGFNIAMLARLPGGNRLSFVQLHRYAADGADGINVTMRLMDSLQRAFPSKPVTLGEFGYSNARPVAGVTYDPNNPDVGRSLVPTSLTAAHEMDLWLQMYAGGYGGGFKWMLTNFPPGFNPQENAFGLLDDAGQPKSSYYGLAQLAGFAGADGQAQAGQGGLAISSANTSPLYTYRPPAGNALLTNQPQIGDWPIRISQTADPATKVGQPFGAWWRADPSAAADISIYAAADTNVQIDAAKIFPAWNWQDTSAKNQPSLWLEGAGGVTFGNPAPAEVGRSGGILSFIAKGGARYRLALPLTPTAFNRAAPKANATYYGETGHNLSGSFRDYWTRNGGLSQYGFPVSEEFFDGGYIVQYFERARFEWHPENDAPYDVLLALLGHQMAAGRDNEQPFTRMSGQSTATSWYFPETGHTLSYGFRDYWIKYGGLAHFGYPISQEFTEVNPSDGRTYTVQYFERARFEFHPDNQPPYDVLQGLLGIQAAKARGWLR